MKINIPAGTRGTLREFKESYQPEFLSKYGYKRYTKIVPLVPKITVCEAVNVKYGETIQGELIVYDDESAMKAVVLVNNEISRKLIKARY